MSKNPAALQGWVKSLDPNTGRPFYANHVTRKTQWDPPAGWVEEPAQAPPPALMTSGFGAATATDSAPAAEEEPLPSNWEMMTDPTTGKPFYVDHERKITQWTRPTAPKRQDHIISHAPAETATTSAALARIMQATRTSDPYASYGKSAASARSYKQEASYFNHDHSAGHEADFSDALPTLDFSVKKVADKYRLECPQCDALFTLRNRRHHCRLCGDVFCDNCSNNRVELPLPGPEFEKPVRVCDLCNKDVEKGNFFSMRRYITPLQLFDPSSNDDDDEAGVASVSNVNAALSGITQDLNQIVQSAEGFEDKVTIPIETLIPCITKHLDYRSGTTNRAVHALATLLGLGAMVGKHDFAHNVYLLGRKKVLDQILGVLERSGSDRKTLFVQEQAARILFYLTDAQVITSFQQRSSRRRPPSRSSSFRSADDDDDEEAGSIDSLDISRTLKSMLDHSSMSKNIHLQRWAAATVRNLIAEDQRRACMAINENAGRIASGESAQKLQYQSFLDDLIATGGIIILCSLVGSDDSDTRAHATAALGTILSSTRAIDESMAALHEMSGGSMGSTKKKDGDIIRAISAGGGCGSSVSQLLLSADNAVAKMGCEFLSSLVQPLLSNPQGCITLNQGYDCKNDTSGLGACRESALELATSSCLPALISIVNVNGSVSRPLELRKMAMETLAATVNAIGEMGKAWAGGKYEEGMTNNGAPNAILRALAALNEEHVVDVAMAVLKSSSGESLGSDRDTPVSRIRESSGIILGAMSACSADAVMDLHGTDVLPTLIVSSNDACMTAPSTLRGDSAPRCVGLLETAASVMTFNWLHPSGATSSLLDRLLETLDVGIMAHLFQMLNAPVEWDSRDKSSGGMKAQAAACRLCCCLFGIAITSNSDIGMKRLMDACDAGQPHRQRQSRGPRNIMEAVLTVLQTSLNHGHKMLVGSSNTTLHYQAALLDLVEAALLAVGSMSGSAGAPGGVDGVISNENDEIVISNERFLSRRAEVCRVACDIVVRKSRSGPSLLPSMLVGGFGEGVVAASLRLALAIAHNGNKEQHSKLASSGILVPISDLLRVALSKGQLYNFSAALALVKFCGPYVTVGTGGETQAIKNSIAVVTNMLNLPINPAASAEQKKTQGALKAQCIKTLESLSRNASLWSTISSDALPSIVQYLNGISLGTDSNEGNDEAYCSALRAVREIVQVPSNAVAAAQAGLAVSVGKLLQKLVLSDEPMSTSGGPEVDSQAIQLDAVAVLCSMLLNAEARRYCSTADGGILASICSVMESLRYAAEVDSPGAAASSLPLMCMEVLHVLLEDLRSPDGSLKLQGPGAAVFIRTLVGRPGFLKMLCATLLLKTGMQIRQHDGADGDSVLPIPDLYGVPIKSSTNDPCRGFTNVGEASDAFLFTSCVLASSQESSDASDFWSIIFEPDVGAPQDENADVAMTFCAMFLSLVHSGYVPFNDESKPTNEIERSLVSYRLLETLQRLLSGLPKHDISGEYDFGSFIVSMLIQLNAPAVCLSSCKDQALLPLAFGTLRTIMSTPDEEMVPLLIENKQSALSLFDLLNLQVSDGHGVEASDVQSFIADALEKLSKNGMLKAATIRFGIRSQAISGLAAACIRDQSHIIGEDLTSSSLSSGLMQCLVDLCTYEGEGIVLTSIEAQAIAKSLGKKICHMVISRFLERAKLTQYDIEQHDDMLEAPDIAMLCAIAQHENGLKELRTLGGFHALALVAGEGELMALHALEAGCAGNPELLMEGETYVSLMALFSEESQQKEWFQDGTKRNKVESIALLLLASLAKTSGKGRKAVAAAKALPQCIERTLAVVRTRAPEVVAEIQSATNDADEGPTISDDGNDDDNADDKDDTPVDDVENSMDKISLDNNADDDDDDNESEERKPAPSTGLNQAGGDSEPTTTSSTIPAVTSSPGTKEVFSDDVLVASLQFLVAIVQSRAGLHDSLIQDGRFVAACDEIVKSKTESGPITVATIELVSTLAEFVTDDSMLSTSRCVEFFGEVLQEDIRPGAGAGAGTDGDAVKPDDPFCLHTSAMLGMQVLFGTMSPAEMKSSASIVSRRLAKLIRGQSIPKSTASPSWNKGSGQLAFTMTSFLLRLAGSRTDLFDKSTVNSMANIVQWRVDPKSSIHAEDQAHWDAAVTQSLQIMDFLFNANRSIPSKSGLRVEFATKAVLMIAKPGKAPRQSVNLLSALEYISAKGESISRVLAAALLTRIRA